MQCLFVLVISLGVHDAADLSQTVFADCSRRTEAAAENIYWQTRLKPNAQQSFLMS